MASDVEKILEISRRMDEKLSKTVKISHLQVLEITVADLSEKYIFNIQRGNKDWALAFEKVLQYYLDEQEMSHLTKRALDGAKAPRKSKRSTGSPHK